MSAGRAAGAVLAAGLVLLPARPLAGEDAGRAAGRWHFRFVEAPAFEISVLFRRDRAGDETRLLVDGGPALGRFVLLSAQGPPRASTLESISFVPAGSGPGGVLVLRRRLFLPGQEFPGECRPPTAKGEPDPAVSGCVVFEGAGAPVAAALHAFAGPGGERLRARVRALVPPALAPRLEGLASLFPSSVEFDAYGDDFVWLAWPDAKARFGRRNGRSGTRTAGCAFDAAFGFPCSPRELGAERSRFGPR